MKAWILNSISNIEYTDTPESSIPSGFVKVRVMAAGICGSDIPRIYRTGAHNMPIIPGHEFSGIVEETGENTDSTLLGKRVGVFPLIPCKQCGPCKKGLYEMCRNYDYFGSRSNGGFAEYVNVPAENLIILPDSVPFEVAAMLEPMSVAVHAMRKGLATLLGPDASSDKDKDISIAVCGLGAIGLMVITFLTDLGYKNIFAIGNKDYQKDRIKDLGLPEDRYIEYGSDKCKAISESIDLFFECVGTNESLELGVRSAAPGGVVVTVGNPASDMTLSRDIYWKMLRNQLRVCGTWNSSFTGDPDDDWHYVIDRIQAGQMDPAKLISHRFSFEKLEKGLLIMRDKTENYCKVMAIRK